MKNKSAEVKTDLRVVKTKRNIKGAFLKLLQTTNLENIQVMDICTEAACSRNTFYTHYYNKYELYQALCDECVKNLCETLSYEHFDQDYVNLYGYGTEIIHVAAGYKSELTLLLKSNSGGQLKEQLCRQLYAAEYEAFLKKNQVDFLNADGCLALHYQIAGIVEFICYWITEYAEMDEVSAAKLHAEINSPVAETLSFIINR